MGRGKVAQEMQGENSYAGEKGKGLKTGKDQEPGGKG